jgi:hypothetical protein
MPNAAILWRPSKEVGIMKTPLRLALSATAGLLAAVLLFAPTGCKKPTTADLYGEGRFKDVTQIKVGMSQYDVERVMGSNHQTVWEEGIAGMDGGNTIWEYPEARVYFNTDGVFKVVPRQYRK